MNKKIIKIAETVSNEKSLPKEKIFEAIEEALKTAIKKKYDKKINIKVKINRINGIFNIYRRWKIVKKVQFIEKEINIKNIKNPLKKIGEYIKKEIKIINFNRMSTQIARQIITQKMKEAQKIIKLKKIKKKKGKIIYGFIKKIKKKYITINVGYNIEAILLKKDMIEKENYKIGNKINGLIYKIKKTKKKYKILITRKSENMLVELLKINIPEIKNKIINIKAISRIPGNRSKIAVKSTDNRIDPIGACIGVKGIRIQSVSNELFKEKIDIILWDKNPKKFIVNAMMPIEISKISINKNKNSINIKINKKNFAKAIGKNGQNIKLTSLLTGWNINIKNNEN